MKIYKFETRHEYMIGVVDDEGLDDPRFDRFYHGSKKEIITSELDGFYSSLSGHVKPEQVNEKLITNITLSTAGMCFDEKAMKALDNFWNDGCEFYPIKVYGKQYYALNMCRFLEDSLVYEKSIIKWVDEAKLIAWNIEKYEFVESKITEDIFSLRERRGFIYTSEKFKNACIEANLTGYDFLDIYDSDDKTIAYPFKSEDWRDLNEDL